MKFAPLLLLLASFTLLLNCSGEIPDAQINGFISNENGTPLRIDGQEMVISKEGQFTFTKSLEQFIFLEASYGDLEWNLFLTPGCQFELHIQSADFQDFEYIGELKSANSYLLKTSSLSREINAFFNKNWIQLHTLEQDNFIAAIDSLKGLYFQHLEDEPEHESLATEFRDAWKAEIDYAFNALVLRYPERYVQFPPKAVLLSENSLDYLESSGLNRIEYADLAGFKSFANAWIDYNATLRADRDSSHMHYGLKKMDYAFEIISNSFQDPFLQDYWMSAYLKKHLELQGISNAEPYLDLFYQAVQTESLRSDMDESIQAIEQSRKDHTVQIYKQENGFKLEAHFFTPMAEIRDRFPSIVIFHGGGWNSGNPSWAYGRAKHFAEQGLLAVAVQYRLTNKQDITAVESMADARDLVIWMRTHADSLHIDPDKIAGYGWSAGAHLISSAAIFPELDPETGFSSSPDALVLVSPAVSLPKGEGWKYWNYNVLGTKATVDEVNPLEHVRKGLPPTIILQGNDDTVTPLDGVKSFSDRMNASGNHCELCIYENVGHLFTPNYLPDNGWPRPDQLIQEKAYKQIDEFLMKQGYLN